MSLESQLSCDSEEEVRQAFLKLSRAVRTKLHIVKHVLMRLENSSYSASDYTMSNVQHCFNEISFSINWLARLREGRAAFKTRKVGE